MGRYRFLFSAVCLLGSCDLLWAPFQGPNSAFCDPSSPDCPPTSGDGGVDPDGGVPDGALPGDGAATADMTCKPATASAWVAETTPPSGGAIALAGVTGSPTGDIWVVGPTAYAAHWKSGSWNQLTLPSLALITNVGRAAYFVQPGLALAVADGTGGGHVVQLTATASPAAPLVSGLGSLSGIWVSPGAAGVPYVVGINGEFKTSTDGSTWNNVGVSAPPDLAMASGVTIGAVTSVWGVSTTDKVAAAYSGMGQPWSTTSSGASALNSVWLHPTNGAWLVGKGGVILTAPATAPPVGPLTAVSSLTTQSLADVAGTADGRHLWAVGDGGTILHFESMCQTWTKEQSPSAQDLGALFVSDAQSLVWAVGKNGTVMHRAIP